MSHEVNGVAAAVDAALGRDVQEQEVIREQIKADLQKGIAEVDAGNFRAVLFVRMDPVTGKNHLVLHGDRDVIVQACIRILQKQGLLQTA